MKGKIEPQPETSEHAALEEMGVAFDPSTQHVDLSKEEKRRTTALLMAIQAYDHLIIKDAEMYIAVSRDQPRNGGDGPVIQPATMDAMVRAALLFDAFIAGKLEKPATEEGAEGNAETAPPTTD